MKLAEACFAWTPNNGAYPTAGYRGHFLIVTDPNQASHLQHSESLGIQTLWRQLSQEKRVEKVRLLVEYLVSKEGILQETVDAELTKIEDWPGR